MGGCICSNESCGLWISFHVDFFSCWCHGSQNFPVNPTDWTKFCVHHPCIYFLLIQYSFEDLLNLVQGSETEIKESLKKLQACQIEGKKKSTFSQVYLFICWEGATLLLLTTWSQNMFPEKFQKLSDFTFLYPNTWFIWVNLPNVDKQ